MTSASPVSLPLGPVMVDVVGTTLTDEDIRRLMHPLVGSVILFSRSYQTPEQLKQLTATIKALRTPELLIAVDHEGGRVQRFHEGFTTIPPMRKLGELWDRSQADGLAAARAAGQVIGCELGAHGLDFSFTPVLDLDWGESGIIGHRAFHRDPAIVTALAGALIGGLHDAGMAVCGKHYPGHGYVRADSHLEIPRDERSFEAIAKDDLVPFAKLSAELDSIMPAHIIFEQVDALPAGFSPKWLKEVLRAQLGFKGIIFSDDLTMEGAAAVGGIIERALAAFRAGCDIVPLCNNGAVADQLLAGLTAQGITPSAEFGQRFAKMRYRGEGASAREHARYREALACLTRHQLI